MSKRDKFGCVFFHYQDDIKKMGRFAARATPSDAGIVWTVYPPTVDDAAIKNMDEHQWFSSRGPGSDFIRPPSIRRSSTRVLVKQTFGLDV